MSYQYYDDEGASRYTGWYFTKEFLMDNLPWVILGAALILGGGLAWYIIHNTSYGPPQFTIGTVANSSFEASYTTTDVTYDSNHNAHFHSNHHPAKYILIVSWEFGQFTWDNERVWRQVKIGSRVGISYREKFWKQEHSGWTVDEVDPNPPERAGAW